MIIAFNFKHSRLIASQRISPKLNSKPIKYHNYEKFKIIFNAPPISEFIISILLFFHWAFPTKIQAQSCSLEFTDTVTVLDQVITIGSKVQSINLMDNESGIYFVQIQNGSENIPAQRIIIQK